MCRFVTYLGKPVVLSSVLSEPDNSLVKQSKHAKEMINTAAVNGDGFGIGWYQFDFDQSPGVFKSICPAWNDVNLDYLLPKVRSHCFLGHIRAAVHGGVDFGNSHPFHHGRYLFMHNGTVGGFQKVKRHLRHLLCDEVYSWVNGQTDTEHVAALFLQMLLGKYGNLSAERSVTQLAEVLEETFNVLFELQRQYSDNVSALTVLNFVISDGNKTIVSRYCNDYDHASTLYYAVGSEYCCENSVCVMPKGEEVGAVLVASEKLDEKTTDWHEVPRNHMLLLEPCVAPQLVELTIR